MGPVVELGRRAKAASRLLATAPTPAKNGALLTAADVLLERTGEIRAANDADLDAARAAGMAQGPLDRLRLTDARLHGMANGLRTVAALPDPIGDVLDGSKRPNGLSIQRVRVPLGVVAIIYENRPNVTSDAAGLCLKSGNAVLLRGSSTALRSNQAVATVLREGAGKAGLPEDSVILVEDVAHALHRAGVELVGDAGARALVPAMGEATEEDFAREFLALKMSVAVVPDLEAAIEHVNRYGTGHTEAILTRDLAAARRFVEAV